MHDQTSRRSSELRKSIIRMAHASGEGHVPSSFSIVEILCAAFDYSTTRPEKFDVILSKGHGSLALYALLAERGLISPKSLEDFCTPSGILGGHPDSTLLPGVPTSTGSLGHGLPFGIGLASARKARGEKGNVIVIVGDGECNEGTTWESALLASKLNLSGFVVIVDFNKSGERAVPVRDLEAKWKAFGWETLSVDGHDVALLDQAIAMGESLDAPLAVIAHTVKGKGISRMEDNPAWHHTRVNGEDFAEFMIELEGLNL